jgi:hypothetical protein
LFVRSFAIVDKLVKSYSPYFSFFEFIQQFILQEKTFNLISMAKYMKYPSQELPFKDIIDHEAWQSDDVFTQQRLAGLNPMSLRKMTIEGEDNVMHLWI